MKRLLSTVLALTLLVGLVPLASAAPVKDTLKITQAKDFTFTDITQEIEAFSLINTSPHEVNLTIEIYDQADRKVLETVNLVLPVSPDPVSFKAKVYKALVKNGDLNTYTYKIRSANGYRKNLYIAQKLVITKENVITYNHYINTYFYNNTVSSFGPHFRDVTPELTDLWYMFTPIDLTIQGRQTFELAASNMYVIGEVYVDVAGDMVTVTYHNYYDGKGGSTEPVSEFLTFFNSYADVQIPNDTPVKEYQMLPTNFAFGRPFSTTNDLGGDANVLMFIRNVVNYFRFPTGTREFRRFYENNPDNKALREHMLRLMDPILTVLPETPNK
jgi:hypothetical protein